MKVKKIKNYEPKINLKKEDYNLCDTFNFQEIEEVSLPWLQYSMCVEVWPAQWMKNSFTIIILCIQYLLPLIVLPLVHSQVRISIELSSSF